MPIFWEIFVRINIGKFNFSRLLLCREEVQSLVIDL